MEAGVERIKKNNAAASEQASHQLSERRAVGFAARIGFAQRARDTLGQGTFEGFRSGGYERLDRLAEKNFADVAADVLRLGGQFTAGEAVARVPESVIDLGEIVVFGREPKNRDGAGAARSGFFGAADGGESFVEAERGTGKQADLLASYDGDSAGGEAVEIARGRGIELVAGRESAVLLAQDFHDSLAHRGIEANFASGGINAGGGGRMRVKGGDARKIVAERREKLGGVRDFAEGNAVRLHRDRHDTRGPEHRQQSAAANAACVESVFIAEEIG